MWSSQGRTIRLDHPGDFPGGNDESYATGINSSGQVVGWSGTDTVTRGFLWSPDVPNGPVGSMTDLGSLRQGGQSYGLGINSHGQIAGYTAGSPNTAFMWTPTTWNGTDGSMVPIGGAPFYDGFAWPNGMNSYGQIVGDGRTESGTRVFLWMPDSPNASVGSIIDLGIQLSGFEGSNHFAINSYGQIAGGGVRIQGVVEGFVWTPAQGNTTSGFLTIFKTTWPLYGQSGSSVRGINDRGQVVGLSGVAYVGNGGSIGTSGLSRFS